MHAVKRVITQVDSRREEKVIRQVDARREEKVITQVHARREEKVMVTSSDGGKQTRTNVFLGGSPCSKFF